MFLKSLLEAVAIDAQLATGRSGPPRIFVRSSEADDARAVVADFERNGKRNVTTAAASVVPARHSAAL